MVLSLPVDGAWLVKPPQQPELQPSASFLATSLADLTTSCSVLPQQPEMHRSSALFVLLMLIGRASLCLSVVGT
jgi:hypothetical protein